MIKESTKTFLFLFLLIAFLTVFSLFVKFGVKKCRQGQTGKVNRIASKIDVPAIAIFGSSVGEVGLNALFLSIKQNKTVFNYSIDGTSFIQYNGALNEFIKNANENQTLIFIESYFAFQNPHQVSSLERYIANIDNLSIYDGLYALQPDLIFKCKYIPFYWFIPVTHTYYLSALKGWKSFLQNADWKDSLSGYTPIYRKWEADQDSVLSKMKFFNIALDSSVIDEYIKTINYAKSKGKNVIIVLPPIYSGLTKQLTNFKPLTDTLKKVANNTKVTFLDFSNSEMCQSKDFFYNSNHLNSEGANKFTAMLSDSIFAIR